MSDNLKDILSNLNPEIDQETLMRYLQGKLSAEQQHEIEKQIVDGDFESDAFEGLQEFKNRGRLEGVIAQLNLDLKKKTEKKKKFRDKLTLKLQPWLIIAIILILLIAIIGYLIIHVQMKGGR